LLAERTLRFHSQPVVEALGVETVLKKKVSETGAEMHEKKISDEKKEKKKKKKTHTHTNISMKPF
jgi:hypothetical protein